MQNKKAFTLVELIVVITILAILWTIAFISLQWYSAQARDSKRVSDINNIKTSLELFSINSWKYPKPDNFVTVKYDTQDLWYQWTVWNQVSTNLSRNLNEKPTDPLTEMPYVYSRTYGGNEYELLSIYESDLVSFNSPLPLGEGLGVRALKAANTNYPKISGNYNWVYVKAGTTYLPTPSIVNALNTDLDLSLVENVDWLSSQITTWWENNISNAWFESSTWKLTWMTIEVFTWELDTDKGEDEWWNKVVLANALIDAYSWTDLANNWVYKTIVNSTDLISLVDEFILNEDDFSNSTISTIPSCDETTAPFVIFDTVNSSPNITFSNENMVATWFSSLSYKSGFVKSDIWVVEFEVLDLGWTAEAILLWVSDWIWDPDLYITTTWALNQIVLSSNWNIIKRTSWNYIFLVESWWTWTYSFWDRIWIKYDSTYVYFYVNGILKNQIEHWYWTNVRPSFILRDNTKTIKIYSVCDMLYSY